MGVTNPTTVMTNGGTALAGSVIVTPATQTGNVIVIGEANQRIFRPKLQNITPSYLMIDGKAMFLYMMFFPSGTLFKFISLGVLNAGVSTQTAELGIFTSPDGPNKATTQTLTKIEATGTIGVLAANNVIVRNSSAFSTALTADAHVWAGFRTSMGGIEPNVLGVGHDWGEGACRELAASGALTASGSFAATIPALPAVITNAVGPYLKLEMD